MKLSQEQKEYLMSKKTTLWLKENRIKNEQGVLIDFQDHLFQYDMYLDMSPKQVVQKPAQVGESTKNILKSLHIARYLGLDIIYTLPTANDVKDFVSGKVNRIVLNNPVLTEWIKDKDSIEQKRVSNNVIYYRGTWTEKTAMMVSSDLNIYDEVDASKQDVLEQYSTRIQHSKFGGEWWFSHPSVEGFGVNKFFILSDQKHWFQKCSRCNYEWYLKFPDNIDLEKRQYICAKCKQVFREEDRRKGRWVKKFKDNTISGYQVNSMFCPWISADKIVQYYKTKSEEYFFNKVLGLPFMGKDNVVSEVTILKNCLDEINDRKERIVIGCDTGLTQYYVMGTRNGIFYYGKSDGYEEIEKILRDYPNSILVMDAKGDLTKPRELQERYRNRVFLCEYRQDRKTLQLITWGEHKEYGQVVVDRNRMIQFIIGEFEKKLITLNGKQEEWFDYAMHWKNIYREEEMDALDMPRRVWKRKGADHWVHATVYFRTGIEKFGKAEGQIFQKVISNIQESPEVYDNKMENVLTKQQKTDWRI